MAEECSADGWCTEEASIDPEAMVKVKVWDGTKYGWDGPVDPTECREYWIPAKLPCIEALQMALRIDAEIEGIQVVVNGN